MRNRYFNVFASFVCFTAAAAVTLSGCGDDSGSGPDAYVPDGAACTDECQAGERICVTGGYQPCGNFDSDDCYELGPTVSCNQGEQCIDGQCEPVSTQDECVEGSTMCTSDGSGVMVCEYRSGLDVWIWAEPVDCPTDESCSCGRCRPGCVDECAQGSKRCQEDGYQTCGNFDADSCMEWGAVTPCTGGQTCSNGSCSTECEHECTANATRCTCSGYVTQTCGDFDEDICLDWGPSIPCSLGETCSNGVCSSSCEDSCPEVGATECTSTNEGYQVCDDYNQDGCVEWGPEIDCPGEETCQDGVCGMFCECDDEPGVCEAGSPNTTTPCACDPDCGTPCGSDGFCDDWCTPGHDPDCGCNCDFNEYCEAESQGSSNTCSCDWDCEPHEHACMDDAHCDTWCPSGADPDCGADPCRPRWMLVGYREANEMWLSGSYNDPDPVEGSPWVELSPGMSSGSAVMSVSFAAEHVSCVTEIKVKAWGYDDATFGDGAEMYLYDWNGSQYDLLPDQTVGGTVGWYENTVINPLPYLLCGSGDYAKCYIDVKIEAGAWDNTHIWDVYAEVYMN
jgi:hypothetical protein